MALLSFTNLGKSYGTNVCFEHISGEVHDGDRIGLIGANGTGKSTLARALARMLEIDEGRIDHAKDTVIQYLAQEADVAADMTLRDATLEAFADVRELERRIDELSHIMADPACSADEMERALEETGHLQHELESRGGYTIDSRTDAVLMGLGFAREDFSKPANGLSGGERSRVGLARVLLREPHLMILDEPTNHLDINGVQWLETYLRDTFKGAYVVISHDRWFLDQVTQRTWELERGHLESWKGGYTRSRELKAEEFERRLKVYEAQQTEIEKQKEYIRRFGANQRATQAKGRKRRLDRFIEDEAIDRPTGPARATRLQFNTERRTGAEVIELRNVTYGYEGHQPLLEDLTFATRTNEVFGIVGPNGAGKTTLLRIMAGELQPHGGTMRMGSTIHPAMLTQREEFAENAEGTIQDHVHEKLPKLNLKQIRDLLAALLFTGDDLQKPLKVLSGGEKKRVALAELLAGDANLLFLDEPTNHLDLPTREALEGALEGFPGTLIVISHDRYLLDRICDRILWLSPDRGFAWPAEEGKRGPEHRVFEGNYSAMLDKVRDEQRARAAERARIEAAERAKLAPKPEPARQEGKSGGKGKGKNKGNDKGGKKARTFKGSVRELEKEIEKVQAQIKEVETALGTPEVYENAEKVKELTMDYDFLRASMEVLESEWLERSSE
ncbi:MAG: ABC-F family ATP-binding cassette domain-containing protein [Planctomycetota bacterium]